MHLCLEIIYQEIQYLKKQVYNDQQCAKEEKLGDHQLN
jgi:hypothetical protein